MKKMKFSKKKIIFCLSSAFCLSLPLVLTSCGQTLNDLVNKSVLKGEDPSKFSSKFGLVDIAKNALKNSLGQKAFIEELASELSLQWYKKVAEDSENKNQDFITSWRDKKKEVEKEIKDTIKDHKEKDKNKWELLYQQNELDANGGTSENWANKQLKTWAKSELQTKLFAKDYSAIIKTSTEIIEPNEEEIFNVLTDPSSSFGFTEKVDLNPTNLDKQFATFQKFIFDEWVQSENPYVVNMSLWKYGAPDVLGGVSTYYNIPKVPSGGDDGEGGGGETPPDGSLPPEAPPPMPAPPPALFLKKTNLKDGEGGDIGDGAPPGEGGGDEGGGEETPPTETSQITGTYIHPYFNDEKTNDGSNTVAKYKSFIEAAKQNDNFKIKKTGGGSGSTGTDKNQNIGLKKIPNEFTEDSSTFILAKNGSIYNDLYTEFAAASAYLYSNIGSTNTDLQKQTDLSPDTPSEFGFDPITKEFVQKSSFNSTSPYGNFKTSTIKENKLTASYLADVINKDGPLKKVLENNSSTGGTQSPTDLYVIDAFQPKDTSLSEFMFLRDEAGVHAISIDGVDYIKGSGSGGKPFASSSADSKAEKAKKAADIVFYHFLMNKNGYSDFEINLIEEMSNFFTNNADYLIVKYALSQTTLADEDKMFDFGGIISDENEKKLAETLNQFLFDVQKADRQKEFVTKMYEAKSKFSTNFGVDAFKNGLAAQWVYKLDTNNNHSDSVRKLHINKDYLYELTNVVDGEAVFNKNNGSRKLFLDAFDKYFQDENNIKPLESKFSGYKYSQLVFAENKFIDAAINAFTNDSTPFADLTKIDALIGYLKQPSRVKKNDNLSKESMESAWTNQYFASTFSSEEVKWLLYDDSTNKPFANNKKGDLEFSKFKTFIFDLWQDSMVTFDGLNRTKVLSFLSTFATLKFLVEDNNQFLNGLREKVTYGTNAFLVWENSYNKKLSSTQSSINNVKDLLKADNLKQNVNNSAHSSYIGNNKQNNNTVDVTNNANGGIFNDAPDYYKVVDGMVGYKGIQTATVNSLSGVVSSYLFGEKQNLINPNLQGILNGFNNANQMKTYVDQIPTLRELRELIGTIQSVFPWLDLSYINDENYSLSELKDEVKKIIDSLNNPTSQIFNPRTNGYVSKDGKDSSSPVSASPSDYIMYGAYFIQINRNDLTSLESLKAKIDLSKPTSASGDKTKSWQDIYSNLVLEMALSSTMQTRMLDKISADYKKENKAFDKRVNAQLNSKWLINWKQQL